MRIAMLISPLAFAASAAAAQDWRPPPAKDGFSYPDCFCLNRGEKLAVGETTCLRVDGREYTARCGMSLNNPAWRFEHDGCAQPGLSLAPPAFSPASARRAPG